jgi:hypothetical protein
VNTLFYDGGRGVVLLQWRSNLGFDGAAARVLFAGQIIHELRHAVGQLSIVSGASLLDAVREFRLRLRTDSGKLLHDALGVAGVRGGEGRGVLGLHRPVLALLLQDLLFDLACHLSLHIRIRSGLR